MPLTKPMPACERGRKPKEPSTSDDCRMWGFCFKTKFSNFKSGWISPEIMFVAPTRKKWDITKVGWPSEKLTFCCPWRRRIFLQKSLLTMQNKGLKLRCNAFPKTEHANRQYEQYWCNWIEPKPVGKTQKYVLSSKRKLPSAPVFEKIPILVWANPGPHQLQFTAKAL